MSRGVLNKEVNAFSLHSLLYAVLHLHVSYNLHLKQFTIQTFLPQTN